MFSINLVLPIYWTKHLKTKPSKTVLTSLNWYRNAYHYDQNAWKQEVHELVHQQLGTTKLVGTYKLHIKFYYKNPSCDGSNVCPLMEKAALDALQSSGVVVNDNVSYHLGTTWEVVAQDKADPRVEIEVFTVN